MTEDAVPEFFRSLRPDQSVIMNNCQNFSSLVTLDKDPEPLSQQVNRDFYRAKCSVKQP